MQVTENQKTPSNKHPSAELVTVGSVEVLVFANLVSMLFTGFLDFPPKTEKKLLAWLWISARCVVMDGAIPEKEGENHIPTAIERRRNKIEA
jgi:hypothetical protein